MRPLKVSMIIILFLAFLHQYGTCETANVDYILNPRLIDNFFTYKSTFNINIYHCLEKKDEIKLMKQLDRGLSIKWFKVQENFSLCFDDVFLKDNGRLGYVFDGVNCNLDGVLDQFSRLQAFTLVHPSLVLLRSMDQIEDAFQEVVMSISTDLQVVTLDSSMYDVYNPSTLHGGRVIIGEHGNWDNKRVSFRDQQKEHLYWRRRNMTGILFNAMVVLPKEFPGALGEYLQSDTDREVNTFNRFHTVLIYHIQDYYGFNLNMSLTNSWGYMQPNGTFDGLVRALQLKQVDFGSSPLFVKGERFPALDYGRRTWKLRSAFVFRLPKKPASFEVFLRPLHASVWYLTVLACIIIVVLLKFSLKTEFCLVRPKVEEEFEPSWSQITLFTIGALCQQGSNSSPNGLSSRIAFIFIFIFTVLLYQYYSASIVSILVMSPPRFIRSLHDLVASTLTLGCEDILYNKDYINKLRNDSDISLLMRKAPGGDASRFYIDPQVGLSLVAQGGYAYHVELATAYPIINKMFEEDVICTLDEVQLFQIQQMHQPLQKRSPFKEMLDYALHRIDESGLMYRQLKHWHAKKPECIRSRPATSSVAIGDFYPALSLLFFGIIISLMILFLENAFYHYITRKELEYLMKQVRIDKARSRIERVYSK